MMIKLPCASIIDEVWTNRMLLLTYIEKPLCLLWSRQVKLKASRLHPAHVTILYPASIKYHMSIISGPLVTCPALTLQVPECTATASMPRPASPNVPSPHFIVHLRSEVNRTWHCALSNKSVMARSRAKVLKVHVKQQ